MVSNKTYYGSGTMYEVVWDENTMTIPTSIGAFKTFVETYCTAANQIGYLKNGFQMQINTEKLEDQSDLGEMKISLLTKEEGTITFALFNANGETISRLYPTATTTNGVTVVGGLANAVQATHLLIFVAAQAGADGSRTVIIALGKNTSGFSVNFNPDSVEPFSCEYSIIPYNTDGNMYTSADVGNLPKLPITSSTVYPIEYVTNGGEWVNAPVESYVPGTGATLPDGDDIVKEGYTFDGWYEQSDITTKVTAIGTTETGGKTFIANWTT